MKSITTELNLPSASRGGNNAYYVSCDVVDHAAAYASCLNKIEQYEAKSEGTARFSDCMSAFRQGRCAAMDMRQEEQLKGVALYFIPRAAIPTDNNLVPMNTMRPAPAKTSAVTPDTGSYADAISAAVKRVLPAMKAGESPMAFAMRCVIPV